MKPPPVVARWLLLSTVVLLTTGCLRAGSRPKVPPVAGIFVSSNQGESWEARHRLVTAGGVGSLGGLSIRAVSLDPQDANAAYLSVAGAGLIYTFDGGLTWQQAAGVTSGTVNAVAVDPKAACTIYVAIDNRLLKSLDCVRSFREIYLDPRPNAVTGVVVDGEDARVVVLGTSAGELLRSSSAGASWSRVYHFGSGVSWLKVDPRDAKRWYLMTARNGLYRSPDRGGQWESLSAALQPHGGGQEALDLQFALDQSNAMFLLNRAGILRSTDGGSTWTALQVVTPASGAKIYAVAVNPGNSREVYYATASTFNTSSDGGVSWRTRRLPGRQVAPRVMYLHPKNPRLLYLAFEILPSR